MRYSKLLLMVGVAALSLNVACTRDPQKLKLEYVKDGDALMKQGKVAEAIISYRNAVSQDTMFAEARLKLAAAYTAVGDKSNAMREAIRAADLLPNDATAQLEAGKWLLEVGQFEDAKNRALKVLAKDPKHVEGLILLGNALVGLQDLDGGIRQIEDAIEADPHRVLSYQNLGFLQAAKGSREEAEKSMKRAVEVEPNNVFARLSLANFLWASRRLEEAETHIRKAVELEPRSPQANKALATLLAETGRPTESEPYLRVFVESSAKSTDKLLLADFLLATNRADEAVALLKTLAADKDAGVPSTLRLAAIDYKADRKPAAYQSVDALLKKDPKNLDAQLAKARFLLNDHRVAEALPVARAAATDHPQDVGGHLLYGAALASNGQLEEAIAEYKEVLKLEPSSPMALTTISDLYFRTGDPEAAAEFIGQVVKNQPNWLVARVLLARSLVSLGNLPRAEQEIASLSQAMPKSAQIEILKGDAAWARRDLPRARLAYTKAYELEPYSFQAFTAMVRVDLAQKKPDSARERVEKRLAEKPNDKATQMLAGDTYLMLRDTASAEKAYKRVIEIDNTSLEAYAQLGSLYLATNRLEQATAEFERAAAREPEHAIAAKTMVGVLYTMRGRHPEARQQYEKVIAIDPGAAVASNNLAYYYSEGGGENLDVALHLAQTAKSKLATNPQVNDTLGWIYYKKGLGTMAVGALNEAVKASPENPILLYHLGMAQIETKQTREARLSLEKALKLQSDFEGANEARQALSMLSK